MVPPVLKTPPAVLPVSAAEAKMHARILFDDEDDLVASLIASAVAHLDGYAGILGRCLVNQDWEQGFPEWRPCLRLPFPNVSAAAIEYAEADGANQTVDAELFEIIDRAGGSEIVFKDAFTRPSLSSDQALPVTVTITAGYGATAADVPAPIKTAILLLVAHWYQNREAVVTGGGAGELPLGVQSLLAPYRRVGV